MKKSLIASLIFMVLVILFCSFAEAIPPAAPQPVTDATLPDYTVATLPSAATGTVVIVTDGSTASDCTVGGGSDYVLCVYNGAAWVAFGDGTGGAGSGSMTTVQLGDANVDTTVVILDFNASVFDVTESPEDEINISLDVTPSSGNATLVIEEDAVQVKYDTTDFTEGTAGLLLGANPTISTSLSLGTDPADAGSLRLPSGGIIGWEDTAETTITHTAGYGLTFNTDLQAADGNTNFIIRADNEANDTLELQAMDIDGSYTSLVTLTSHATAPTLTLASTGNSTYISSGGTVQIEGVTFTDTAISGIASITDGTASWTGSSLTGFADITTTDDLTVGDDLLLHSDSAVLSFGASDDITITHVADTGLNIKQLGLTTDGHPIVIILQTGELAIETSDVLGGVYFQAPDESSGTDALLVAAGIEAVAEADFTSSVNATKLSFKTGASETATEKMSLSSAGLLTVSGDITISGGNINTGNIAFVVGDGTTDSITFTTDGTGEGEVELPDDSIGDEEIDWSDVTGADITLTDCGTITSTGTITSSGTFDVTGATGMVFGSADVTSFTLSGKAGGGGGPAKGPAEGAPAEGPCGTPVNPESSGWRWYVASVFRKRIRCPSPSISSSARP